MMELILTPTTNQYTNLLLSNNDKTTIDKDNDKSNLIKGQSTNSSTLKKDVFIVGDSMINTSSWSNN